MSINLNLESDIIEERGIINGIEYVSYSKGPLLLTLEPDAENPPYIKDGYKLTDYASAGRKHNYYVWIRKDD